MSTSNSTENIPTADQINEEANDTREDHVINSDLTENENQETTETNVTNGEDEESEVPQTDSDLVVAGNDDEAANNVSPVNVSINEPNVSNNDEDDDVVHENETLIPTPPPTLVPADIPIKVQEFSHVDFGLCTFSLVLFMLDYAINCFIFQKFLHLRQIGEANYQVYFWLTFVFIFFCATITGVFEIVWYADEKRKYGHSLKWYQWIINLFFICLLLGPAFRYLELMMFAYKKIPKAKNADETAKLTKKAMMMKEDADFLYMLEKFTESGLHLVLQMYIVKTEMQEGEEKLLGVGEAMKIIIAVILMPYSVTCFLRSERQADDRVNNISNVGAVVQYISRFFIIISQAVVMSMFLTSYPFIFMLITVSTWGFMAIWVFTQNTSFSRHSSLEAIYRFLIAFIYLFNYVNVSVDESYYRALFYYCFMFLEKGLMVCFWTQQVPFQNWYRWPVLVGFFGCFIGGLFIKIIYYECHHPTRQPTSKLYKSLMQQKVKQHNQNSIPEANIP